MPVRFAVNSSLWSSGATWDDGVGPLSGDTVYPNGFTVTIDTNINVASLNNNTSPVILPNMPIPAMTSNSFPSGTVSASTNLSTAFQAFDQNSGTVWATGSGALANIYYQFPTSKTIKRYYWQSDSVNRSPSSWTFDGSNDGSNWTNIETVTGNTTLQVYTSGANVLANTSGFTYYRFNITGHVVFSNGSNFLRIEMTESTGSTYGVTNGGSFTVPSTLSGTRNITQNGAGIVTNSNSNILTLAHNSGNTVNMNVSGSGYIFNPNYQTTFASFAVSQVTGTGTVNFNGDIWGTQTASQYNITGLILISNSATVNVFGNCYGPRLNNVSHPVFNLTNNGATLNITGNLIGADTTGGYLSYIVFNNSLATVNITGNLTSNLGYCYYSTTAGNLNILSGTVTVTNVNSVPAILMSSSSSLLTVKGPIINVSNVSPILAYKMRFYSGQTAQWTVQDTTNANITLSSISSSGITIGLPFSGDVRYLTTYGQNNEYVGSLRVPTIDNVRKGVPFDYTVGTADLTANDIFNAITVSTNSVAVRLRNVSTVQSAGDQIAGLS